MFRVLLVLMTISTAAHAQMADVYCYLKGGGEITIISNNGSSTLYLTNKRGKTKKLTVEKINISSQRRRVRKKALKLASEYGVAESEIYSITRFDHDKSNVSIYSFDIGTAYPVNVYQKRRSTQQCINY